jgi:hypothetical protein
MEEGFAAASDKVQERLQRCMDALAFFTQYPIRLIQDFDVDRRNDGFVLKCLRLEGDGLGFMQEKVSRPQALPRGDLVLDLGDGRWRNCTPSSSRPTAHTAATERPTSSTDGTTGRGRSS